MFDGELLYGHVMLRCLHGTLSCCSGTSLYIASACGLKMCVNCFLSWHTFMLATCFRETWELGIVRGVRGGGGGGGEDMGA